MVHIMGEKLKIFFFIDDPFHFAVPLKDSTLIDGEDRGDDIPVKLTCGMDLRPPLGINLPFQKTIDDDRIDPDLAFDDCRFTND